MALSISLTHTSLIQSGLVLVSPWATSEAEQTHCNGVGMEWLGHKSYRIHHTTLLYGLGGLTLRFPLPPWYILSVCRLGTFSRLVFRLRADLGLPRAGMGWDAARVRCDILLQLLLLLLLLLVLLDANTQDILIRHGIIASPQKKKKKKKKTPTPKKHQPQNTEKGKNQETDTHLRTPRNTKK